MILRSESFASEFRHLFEEWTLRCRPQKVSRPYFEGQSGQNGFLKDFFTCLGTMGLGNTVCDIEPKLDAGGHLPYQTLFTNWAKYPIKTLKQLSALHENLNWNLKEKGESASDFQPLYQYFNKQGDQAAQRAEAGRFMLLISEGCSLMAEMKHQFRQKGFQLLDDLSQGVEPLLLGLAKPHHPLHNTVQECYETLQRELKQKDLAFEEYGTFMKQLLDDRKKHLVRLMVLLNKPSTTPLSQIQGIQLHLEIQLHWGAMDERGEVQGLKSHREFCQHLETFQGKLLKHLQGLEIIQKRLHEELKPGATLNSGLLVLFEGIMSLMEKCAKLKHSFPQELVEKIRNDQKAVLRLLNRLKNHFKENAELLKDWPPLALARYHYLEMESLRVLFRSNEHEIKNMGRCVPYLFKVLQRDLDAKGLLQTESLKRQLEDLIASTGRILKKRLTA